MSDISPAEHFRLLSWLRSPSTDTGLHVAEPGGGWSFTSYRDLAEQVHAFAAELHAAEAAPGAVVTLLATEVHSFVVAFMGTLAAGLTPSPVAPPRSYRTTERYRAHLARIIEVARPAVVVTQQDTQDAAESVCLELGAKAALIPAPTAESAARPATASATAPTFQPPAEPAERAAEDLALLQFTSGSSGNPKGVRVSWGALTANVGAIRDWLRIAPGDVFASWLPLFHDMGLVGAMIMPVTSGIDLWLMTPEQFVRAPERWLECFGRHGATVTTAPSFGYAHCARRVKPEQLQGTDFSAWRVAILGAERIDPQAVADFAGLLRPYGFDERTLVGAYGLAESTLAVTGVTPGEGSPLLRTAHPAAEFGARVEPAEQGLLGRDRVAANWLVGCGRPVGDLRVEILDEDGLALPEGHFGQISVAGSSVADGYLLGDGQLTLFDPAGLHTGDGGFLWEGQLYVIGRVADSLKIRGAAVFAEDLEADLALLPGLAAGRLVTLLGHVDGTDHAVLLVEEPPADGWLEPAINTLRAATGPELSLTVLTGRRGAIERTSSGKPRRRVLWQRLLRGESAGWTHAYGTPPTLAAPAGAAEPDSAAEAGSVEGEGR